MEFKHTSVLLQECIDGLNIRPDGLYIDGTLGGGGHSFEIAKRLTQGGVLIGIDQDEEALSAAGERLFVYSDRVRLVHDNYENMENAVRSFLEETAFSVVQREEGQDKISGTVDGILLDLGVSSYQLDNPERGFSYRTDAPLDMRMDRTADFSARDIVNTYSAENCREYRKGERDRPYRDDRQTGSDRGEIHPDENAGEGRQSLQEDISGCPDRLQQRAGGAGGHAGYYDRYAKARRKALHHHLPFTGGPDRQKCFPQE